MKKTLKISGMSCNHCVKAVREALSGVKGVEVLDVSIGSAAIDVTDESIQESHLSAILTEEGFELESVEPSA